MKKLTLSKTKFYFYLMAISVLLGCEDGHMNADDSTNTNTHNTDTEIITIETYDNKQLTYKSIDGKNIFENDIILTEDQINFLKTGPENQNITNKNSTENKVLAAPGVFLNRWTNSTVNFKISFTGARNEILIAINHLEANTNINFIEQATGSYIDFVFVDTDEYCGSSNLGMIGGRQEIKLNCTTQRTIIHEILHALGFYHEHTRPDRDDYININWNNIESKYRSNFDKSISQSYGVFDYNSVMLYSSYAFATDTSIATMTKKNDASNFWGGSNLSATDIAAIVDMYYTPNSVQNVSSSIDIVDVGANSNGDYIYISKNRSKYELYKNGVKTNSNFSYNYNNYGIDITNSGQILTSSSGYNNETIDISEGNGSIFCLSNTTRSNITSLYKKNGNSWSTIINDNSFKRLTVDNQGNAWVLSDDDIKVFNNSGSLINTINITPYVTTSWEEFNDIGNAGDEIYVSIKNVRNSGTMLLKYSSILNQFIKQPKPDVTFSIDRLDGSGNGDLWYSK
ncbi:MAG: M12 family metallopeptidase [Algibacter sp.]